MTLPIETLIERNELRLRDAMLRSDLDELDALLDDDLVFTDHTGGTWRKEDDIAAHRSGAIRIDALAASDQRIRRLDGVAVVSVRLDIAGLFGGQAASGTFRFTRVWANRGEGRWRVVAAQSTLVQDTTGVAERGSGE